MNRLFIVRHGIAYPSGSPDFEEDERPLTPKGKRRMKQIAWGLSRLGVCPDRIASSPLPRARQTAEILARRLGREGRLDLVDQLRPDRSAESIRDWLDAQPDGSLMIVGHNPAFSELITMRTIGPSEPPSITQLKKGGLAAFTRDEGGRYQLDWLATPRLLRRLA